MDGYELLDESAKWWGPDRHIVIYYVTRSRDEIYFTTSQPEPDFQVESWSATGDVNELRAAFADFHPDVRAVLDACPSVHKWAIFERDPLAKWTEGNITLMGDACHPISRPRSGVSKRRASRAPPRCRQHPTATSSCAKKPTPTGYTATTPGPWNCRKTVRKDNADEQAA